MPWQRRHNKTVERTTIVTVVCAAVALAITIAFFERLVNLLVAYAGNT